MVAVGVYLVLVIVSTGWIIFTAVGGETLTGRSQTCGCVEFTICGSFGTTGGNVLGIMTGNVTGTVGILFNIVFDVGIGGLNVGTLG